MSAKHATPEYRANARIIRQQVKRKWATGEAVTCGRTGAEILPGQPFDVGHIDEHGGNSISNLRPEHRRANRQHGGRIGAARTNTRPRPSTDGLNW